MAGGALQERQRAAAVSALSMAAADGNLRDALPEAAVPIIDVVGLPDILEELVGQFILASTGKQAAVTITRRNASHAASIRGSPSASQDCHSGVSGFRYVTSAGEALFLNHVTHGFLGYLDLDVVPLDSHVVGCHFR